MRSLTQAIQMLPPTACNPALTKSKASANMIPVCALRKSSAAPRKKERKRPAAVTQTHTFLRCLSRCIKVTPRGWNTAETWPSALRMLNWTGDAPNRTMNLVMKLLPIFARPP